MRFPFKLEESRIISTFSLASKPPARLPKSCVKLKSTRPIGFGKIFLTFHGKSDMVASPSVPNDRRELPSTLPIKKNIIRQQLLKKRGFGCLNLPISNSIRDTSTSFRDTLRGRCGMRTKPGVVYPGLSSVTPSGSILNVAARDEPISRPAADRFCHPNYWIRIG